MCAKHPAQPAGWQCADCDRALCTDCTALKRFHPVDILVCCLCRGRAEVLRVHRSTAPLGEQLQGVWRHPLQRDALPNLLGMALWITLFEGGTGLILAGLDLFETLWAIIPAAVINTIYAVGLVCAWMMSITVKTSVREDAFGGLEVTELARDLFRPAWLAVVGLSWVWGPALSRVLDVGDASLTDPVLWLCAGVFAFYAPAVLLIACAGGTTLDVINPLRVVGTIRELGKSYLRVMPIVAAAALPAVVLQIASVHAWSVVPLLLPYPLQVAALVPVAVVARALGVLLRVHGDRLGHGYAGDYLEPVLPGAEPKGIVP